MLGALMLVNSLLGGLSLAALIPLLSSILTDSNEGLPANSFFAFFSGLDPRYFITFFVVVFLGGTASTVGLVAIETVFVGRLRAEWTERIYKRLLEDDMTSIGSYTRGAVQNTLGAEIVACARLISYAIEILISILNAAVILVFMMLADWKLLFLFVIGGGFFMLTNRMFLDPRARRLGKERRKLQEEMTGRFSELSHSIKEYRILGIGLSRLRQAKKLLQQFYDAHLRLQLLRTVPSVMTQLLILMAVSGLFVYSLIVGPDEVRPLVPVFIFFALALSRCLAAAQQISTKLVEIADKAAAMARVTALLGEAELAARAQPAGDKPVPAGAGDITFEGVSFGFASRPVIRDLSLRIPKGKITCIIGGSGAGKSTLIDLLVRLYEPWEGRITFDGMPINQFDLAQWRRKIGYVAQHSSVFEGTLRSNVLVNRASFDEAKMNELAAITGMSDIVAQASEGWDTPVGRLGSVLSGGQAKRIAIARALVNEPGILVLDEATTTFEESLEKSIFVALRKARPDISIVLITHRLSSARDTDLVHLLQDGVVTATGGYDDVAPAAEQLLINLADPA
ncbi:ABC transporter ATP-binding protein [Ferrovibrio terrae]|uniref:ABC transporter ATP-binding protein n=2 Tax=Ferrovibrio terrae TaxID=2594003 RepID=A0A516GXU3_9PROT|nr:ABC transporter ATP-binding protein [Ferrovibrio terrae]